MSMTLDEIAREMVACEKWQWLPGMLATGGYRVDCIEPPSRLYPDGRIIWSEETGSWSDLGSPDLWPPNLTDPATLGCVREVVRLAWGAARIEVHFHSAMMFYTLIGYDADHDPSLEVDAQSEIHVLLAALQEAPK